MNVNQSLLFEKYGDQGWETADGRLIEEASVTLTVNGAVWLTFACSPDHLDVLAAGFLFTEGLLKGAEEIAQIRVCDDGTNVDVWLNHAIEQPKNWMRSSGCTGGLTGLATSKGIGPVEWAHRFSPDALLEGMNQLYHVEGLYQEYRGLHCSALFDGETIRLHAADIGRHNTIDKLAGQLLLKKLEGAPLILLTTGRISSEMMLKAARMKVEGVVSRTSPTRMAVEYANALGITLVGYARRDSLIAYSHSHRLK